MWRRGILAGVIAACAATWGGVESCARIGPCRIDPGATAGRPAVDDPSGGEFDPQQMFLAVWQRVDLSFYRQDFCGVDWQAVRDEFLPRAAGCRNLDELAPLVNEALARLRTSHTAFYTVNDLDFYHLLDIFGAGLSSDEPHPRFPDGRVHYTGIGILTMSLDGQWFVRGVLDGSPAERAGLRRGQRIHSVDGEPFHPIRSFADRAGQTLHMEVQSAPDPAPRKTISVTPVEIEPQAFLHAALRKSMRVIEHDGRRVAYAHLWSYAGEDFHRTLVEHLQQVPMASADALVIDLREGWGGANPEYLNLFNRQIPQMRAVGRDGTQVYLDRQWRKPVALLVNEATRSGKELLAFGFRKHRIGPVVGNTTSGAVSAGALYPIGTDALLYLAVKGIEVDGEILEGVGVAPDIDVPYPLPYGAVSDPQLTAALEALRPDRDD